MWTTAQWNYEPCCVGPPRWMDHGGKWSEFTQSCLTLSSTRGYGLPGSPIHGIFQARVLEWVAISFSRGSSSRRDRAWISRNAGRCFTVRATSEARSHGPEFWQNMVHWRREWQTTSVVLPWEPHEQYEKAKSLGHWKMNSPGQEVHNMLLEISGEITPERRKGWSKRKNNTQLWMGLVIEARSDAVKSNIV